MSSSKFATIAALALVVAARAAADPGSPDCARYRLYGLSPGMSPREVRDRMDDRGTLGTDRRSAEYSRENAEIYLEYDDDVGRKTAVLVLVRSHLPTSVDSTPVLRSLRERLGDPTTGVESLDDDLQRGPAAWISERCGIVVQATREGEHLWDPSRAGVYIEARRLPRDADHLVAVQTPGDAVVDELLAAPALGATEPPVPTVEEAASEPRLLAAGGMAEEEGAGADDGGFATQPERLDRYYVKPVFPAGARMARLSGVVHLRVVVREDGRVGEAEVVECSRPGVGFEESAVDAVRRWRYRPATVAGRAVTASITVKVDFN